MPLVAANASHGSILVATEVEGGIVLRVDTAKESAHSQHRLSIHYGIETETLVLDCQLPKRSRWV